MKKLFPLVILSLLTTTTTLAQSSEMVSFESSYPEKQVPGSVEFEPRLELLPNPFTDKVYIKTTHPVKEVFIYDENGNKIFESMGSNELDLNHLSAGKYMLRIIHTEGEVSKVIRKD